jgi:ATP-binding cassette, subfamily A (ABC1), member 3
VVSIGFALIPASMISHIVSERVKNLKHMQLLSGMSLAAYWTSNMLFDILKALIPSGIVIGLLKAFDFFYPDIWRVFLLYPVGIVPFTYVSSFLFSNDSVAQTVTIFLHFVVAGIGAIATLIMRCIDSTEVIGDRMHKWMRVVPSFCLTNPVMYMSSIDRLKSSRPDLDLTDNLSLQMVGGDMLGLGVHFAAGILILIIIESGAFEFLAKCPLILKKNRIPMKPTAS